MPPIALASMVSPDLSTPDAVRNTIQKTIAMNRRGSNAYKQKKGSDIDTMRAKKLQGLCLVCCIAVLLIPHQTVLCFSRELQGETPERVGISSEKLEDAYKVVEEAVKNREIPGAVALVAREGKIVGLREYGYAMVTPEVWPMREDTIFDLASLTKPIATATSIMILLEKGEIRLDDRVTLFIPEFGKRGKEDVTLRHLLTHTSGLPSGKSLFEEYSTYKDIVLEVCNIPLENAPGTKYVYSDLGYIILGEIVRRVGGKSLDKFAMENIFQPLGMEDTMFNPPEKLRPECAATEYCKWRKRIVVGEVHDENAYAMGGVSGHAGLFSTAKDLAIFGQMMLNRGEYNGARVLNPSTVESMTKNQISDIGGDEGLGWFTKSKEFSSGGDLISENSYGHTGFTGTSIWIDPDEELIIILLTNRVHPTRENKEHIRLRPLFANAVVGAIMGSSEKDN